MNCLGPVLGILGVVIGLAFIIFCTGEPDNWRKRRKNGKTSF